MEELNRWRSTNSTAGRGDKSHARQVFQFQGAYLNQSDKDAMIVVIETSASGEAFIAKMLRRVPVRLLAMLRLLRLTVS